MPRPLPSHRTLAMEKQIAAHLEGFWSRLTTAVATREWQSVWSILSEQRLFVEANLTDLSKESKEEIQQHLHQALLLAKVQRSHIQDDLTRSRTSLAILSAYQDSSRCQTFESVG
jgi:hypothetical protein